TGQPAAEPRQGLPALRFRLRRDEVAETFHLGEIELAVLEGAPCELSRLGEPHAGLRGKSPKQAAYHGGRTVHLKLSAVLAGEAVRSREPGDEPGIDGRAVETERVEGKPPGLGQGAGERNDQR